MAYLHCHNCEWEQDDFWDERYNPIQRLHRHIPDLLAGDLNAQVKMDQYALDDMGYPQGITGRELLAHAFEVSARRVRNMVYRTEQELRAKNPEMVCPECGKAALDID